DFSKGYFDYKTRWANKSYDFEYHIWYDSKSLTASIIAFSLKTFFTLKQKLREKEINTKLHKLRFLLKNSKKEALEEPIMNYQFSESTQSLDLAQLKKISLDEESNAHLKPMVFDFLYLNSEILDEVALYKIDDTSNSYLISGKKPQQEVKVGRTDKERNNDKPKTDNPLIQLRLKEIQPHSDVGMLDGERDYSLLVYNYLIKKEIPED